MKTPNDPWAALRLPVIIVGLALALGTPLLILGDQKFSGPMFEHARFIMWCLAGTVAALLAIVFSERRARGRERGKPLSLHELEPSQTYELVGEPGHSGEGALHAVICISKPGRHRFVVEVEPCLQRDFGLIRQISKTRRFTYFARSSEVPGLNPVCPMVYYQSVPFVAEAPAHGFSLVGLSSAQPLSQHVSSWPTGLPVCGATPGS